MEHVTGDVPVHYVEHGDGAPVLALHGAGVDHREVMACLDPVFDAGTGYRRIYPDLPGMGRTPAPETISSADDVLDVLLGFIDGVIGDQQLLVAGHSAGGYYAQAIAGHRPEQVIGLALLCPLLAGIHDVPEHQVVHALGQHRRRRVPRLLHGADRRDAGSVRAVRRAGRPPGRPVALARIGERWELTHAARGRGLHTDARRCSLTGRQDSTVGYARAWELLEHFPRATFAVLDRAGHALPHEQPELIRALVTEWLDRVAEGTQPPT